MIGCDVPWACAVACRLAESSAASDKRPRPPRGLSGPLPRPRRFIFSSSHSQKGGAALDSTEVWIAIVSSREGPCGSLPGMTPGAGRSPEGPAGTRTKLAPAGGDIHDGRLQAVRDPLGRSVVGTRLALSPREAALDYLHVRAVAAATRSAITGVTQWPGEVRFIEQRRCRRQTIGRHRKRTSPPVIVRRPGL